VIDLGTGTGMLALGAALRGPAAVVGVDLDGGALRIAQENRRRVGTATPISWVRADVSRPPLAPKRGGRVEDNQVDDGDRADDGDRVDGGGQPANDGQPASDVRPADGDRPADDDRLEDNGQFEGETRPVTVVMNPPFGAQADNEHADRAFLETTSQVADVSYSVHNRGSREFVESFVADNGGEVTQGFRAEISLPRQFDFHGQETEELDVEVFRIVWSR
jgi:putative methylase